MPHTPGRVYGPQGRRLTLRTEAARRQGGLIAAGLTHCLRLHAAPPCGPALAEAADANPTACPHGQPRRLQARLRGPWPAGKGKGVRSCLPPTKKQASPNALPEMNGNNNPTPSGYAGARPLAHA